MGSTYTEAPPEVRERARRMIKKYHPKLEQAEVMIDFLFAYNEEGPAITHHGHRSIGLTKILNLKDRVKGNGDAEILLDQTVYMGMTDEEKDALIDHELEHIIVEYDAKKGIMKTDDADRPKLSIKKHDYDVGWFVSVADRHKLNSPEVVQARIIWAENGQSFFPMLTEDPNKTETLGEAMQRNMREKGHDVTVTVTGALAEKRIPKQEPEPKKKRGRPAKAK